MHWFPKWYPKGTVHVVALRNLNIRNGSCYTPLSCKPCIRQQDDTESPSVSATTTRLLRPRAQLLPAPLPLRHSTMAHKPRTPSPFHRLRHALNLPLLSRLVPRRTSPSASPAVSQSLLPSRTPPQRSTPSCLRLLFAIYFLLLTAFLALLAHLSPFLRITPAHIRHSTALQDAYTFVAACNNRHETLAMALESWLRVPNARQVVVVDWSSDPPLQSVVDRVVANFNSSVDDLPHVQVVPVEGERDWVLTRAYNLAFRHARFDNVFKLDCDYIVKPTAVKAHLLPRKQDVFFTGYYMNARDANEMHLNGALVISKKRFWAVGGYDERIQTYGYDDEELYKRLTKSGMRKMNISYDEIRHEHHSDDMRAQESVKFPRAQIDMNSLLLEKINSPWGSGYRKSDYKRQGGSEGGLRATYVPKALHTLVGKKTRDELWKTALGRRLRQDFVVPWALVGAMDIVQAEKALWNFCIRKGNSTYDEVTHTGQRVRFVLVHVQNGLGNRLRVLASGLSFAERTRREPIVVWEKDVHFGGSFSDIFDGKHAEFAVLDSLGARWPLKPRGQYDDAWNDIEFFNYMIEENDGKVIVDDEEKSIYFKSDSVMKTPITSWESENVQLQRLRVNSDITARAAQITNRSDFKNVGGVHIRNRSLENDIVGVKDNSGLYHDDDAAEIKKWRATTKYTNFVSEMEDLLESGTVDRFFVASDTVGVLRTMQNLFPEGKVFYLDRDCDDRGGECEQYAMADLLVLSRTKVLLGSTWSSFSEAAMRLGGPKALLAGTDFGELPTSPSSAPSTDQHR